MHKEKFLRPTDHYIDKVVSNFIFHDFPELHNHEYWECFIVTQGSYIHKINKETIIVSSGDAFLIRPEDTHSIVQNSALASHLNIMFVSELIESMIDSYSPKLKESLLEKKFIRFFLNDIQIDKLKEHCTLLRQDDSVIEDRDLVESILTTTILNHVIEQLALLANNKPKWLMNLIDRINRQENLSWSVKDVINEASYSHSHLTREFKRILGCTIVEYLTKVKIAAATEYLIHSDKSISEISYMLGYDSVSHLNHIYKEKMGISPLRYRKQYRSNKNKEK